MRRFFYTLLAAITLTMALMIQIDLISVLRLAASGISTAPLGIYLLWVVVDLIPFVNYRFFVTHALWFFLASDSLFILVWIWLKLAFKREDRAPYNRYRFK